MGTSVLKFQMSVLKEAYPQTDYGPCCLTVSSWKVKFTGKWGIDVV